MKKFQFSDRHSGMKKSHRTGRSHAAFAPQVVCVTLWYVAKWHVPACYYVTEITCAHIFTTLQQIKQQIGLKQSDG